jgi:exo-beta-1,3-glucanase (GH17 family)
MCGAHGQEAARSRPLLQAAERGIHGVCYGPFREGQAPGETQPTAEQISEDLRLMAKHWEALRVYGSDPFVRQICEIVRAEKLPLHVMIGAWIDKPDVEPQNRKQVEDAIAIANDFPDVVCAVSVGNESQVSWSFHKVDTDLLIEYVRKVRSETKVPVTVADDFTYWTEPASLRLASELDFIVAHIYAMWHAQPLDKAMAFTQEKYQLVRDRHPEKLVVIGEAGWATAKSAEGDQAQRLLGTAGETEQAAFYDKFSEWSRRNNVPAFYFEAFDEPWKGGPDPLDAEKHWGLFKVDRQPKAALR